MYYRQLVGNFNQQHLEPFYAAWARFNELLERFPYHNVTNKYLTYIFYCGLDEETRSWVENGFSATGIRPLESSYEDVLYILNDMADFDYRCHLDPSLQDWNHQYPQNFEYEEEKQKNLEDLIAALTKSHIEFMNETRENFKIQQTAIEKLEVQAAKLMTMAINEYRNEECNSKKTSWEIAYLEDVKPTCEKCYSFEDELNLNFLFPDMIINEVQLEGTLVESLNENKKKTILVVEEIINTIDLSSSMVFISTPLEDPFFPIIPHLINCVLHDLIQVFSQVHSKRDVVDMTSINFFNLANLEGIFNQDPCVILHDTYYGRMPLFDKLLKSRV